MLQFRLCFIAYGTNSFLNEHVAKLELKTVVEPGMAVVKSLWWCWVLRLRGHWMVHGPGRRLIVILMPYSNSFVSRPIKTSQLRNDRGREALGIDSRALSASHAHVGTYTGLSLETLLHKLSLAHTLWESVSKAHCFDSRHMSRRRRVCRLINHLAADDLWKEWPHYDKVCEPCTFNYGSEGSTYISMQHPSPLLLITLR